MVKKWKIFGIQTNLEWYDVKTKFKQLLRKISYSRLSQEIICTLICGYMKLVFCSSKKIFVNQEILFEVAKNKTPLIIGMWHNRLMMTPFASKKIRKKYPNYKFMTLASKHGDGKFVGRVMEKFGLITIFGSSNGGRKASRGIDITSMRKIFNGLKNGDSIGITPDGPRGPNQKINGEIINIARISGAGIIAASYSCSRFKQLNTWDNFKIPLPFSTLCFYFDESPIFVPKKSDEADLKKIKILLEKRLNFVQEKSLELTK